MTFNSTKKPLEKKQRVDETFKRGLVSLNPPLRNLISMSTSPKAQSLLSVSDGHSAIVQHVDIRSAHGIRLLEMGLVPGTQVEVIRRAPLGDPVEIHVRNFSLSLRKDLLELLEVVPSDT